MIAEIDLSTEQKHHIAFAIDELEAISNRSLVEEITLNVLKAILPERLPSQTKLMANYPNPFNPEHMGTAPTQPRCRSDSHYL